MRIKLQNYTSYYIADLVCLLGLLSIIGFFVYVSPYLFLGVNHYQVPHFVESFSSWLQHHQTMQYDVISFIWFLPLIIVAYGFYMVASKIGLLLQSDDDTLRCLSDSQSIKIKLGLFLFIIMLMIFGGSTEYAVIHLFMS